MERDRFKEIAREAFEEALKDFEKWLEENPEKDIELWQLYLVDKFDTYLDEKLGEGK